ncbi:hypothetical protein [Aurantimonas marianensis]|uniref:Uncharacterized protein n=1 Tax=Aurantimonas marianensis TaxID=2920428 RepID=A0A9X2KG30_9HYPH|nr:hypothetical protein [Aurantimonas marianensis]MCP3057098.1 hypothetical protein [Aurantimonas marianensis]
MIAVLIVGLNAMAGAGLPRPGRESSAASEGGPVASAAACDERMTSGKYATQGFAAFSRNFAAVHFFANRLLTSKAGTAYKPLIDGEDAAGEPLGLLWCQAVDNNQKSRPATVVLQGQSRRIASTGPTASFLPCSLTI